MFRQAALVAIDGKMSERAKKPSLHNRKAKSAKSLDSNISYQTLPNVEEIGRKRQIEQVRDIIRHNRGPSFADADAMPDTRINLISNAPESDLSDAADWPNRYRSELTWLTHREQRLEAVIHDKDERLVKALDMLNDELQFWRSYLLDKVGDTMGRIQARVVRLESTISYIKDKQAHVYPTVRQKTAPREK